VRQGGILYVDYQIGVMQKMKSNNDEYLLETESISKNFGAVEALKKVDFKVEAGEVHALIGENGAGKSTLIKILGGVHQPDKGKIKLENEYVNFKNPVSSQEAGISIIFQHFKLMPDLTVAENIFVGREDLKSNGLIDWKSLNGKSKDILTRLDKNIEPETPVKQLTVAEKQFVEIARALSFDAKIVIMDEPTACLNEEESEILFETIRELEKDNYTIIYVSHRLEEIFKIADKATVLRDGELIGTREVAETSEKELVRMMVGSDIENLVKKESEVEEKEIILDIKNMKINSQVNNFDLTLYRGEIVGLAGIKGSGRNKVAKALAGILPFSGEVFLEGEKIDINNPWSALDYGIGHLPQERNDEGIFPQMSVKNNLTIKALKKLERKLTKFIDQNKENVIFDKLANTMNIKFHNKNDTIMSLSGGNQQKILLSRALAPQCKVLILEEPTQGIDVGAKAEIHKLMKSLADEDEIAILMVSSEIPELVRMTDRCIVMQRGEITGILEGEQLNNENIVACATGTERIKSANSEVI